MYLWWSSLSVGPLHLSGKFRSKARQRSACLGRSNHSRPSETLPCDPRKCTPSQFRPFRLVRLSYAALSSQPARERLARVLVNLAPSLGQKALGGTELDVSNQEPANSANITSYRASRLVSEWRRIGALPKHRGKILLHSVDWLLLLPVV